MDAEPPARLLPVRTRPAVVTAMTLWHNDGLFTTVPALMEQGNGADGPMCGRPHPGKDGRGFLECFVEPVNTEIEVAVLGPTEVRGLSAGFSRGAARELVVYLALHPEGASTSAWATALWPDRLMAPSTLHSTASSARRALGRSRCGQEHLPHSHGHLKLASSVSTDWHHFCALAHSSEPAAHDHALALVRGRPFDQLGHSEWTVFEGIAATVEERIADLACSVTDWHLQRGKPQVAAAAARRGLAASPYDERLHRRLLVCADQEGNPGGVERVMSDLVCLLEGGGSSAEQPLDLTVVHPRTAWVYGRLSRRKRPETGRSARTN